MDLDKVVRTNILRLREGKGWTQTELGIQVNKSRSWVAHVESGARKAVPHIELLAKAFGVSVVDLLSIDGGAEEKEERAVYPVSLKIVLQSFIEMFYEDYEVYPTATYISMVFDVSKEVAEQELFLFSVRQMITA